MPTTTGEEIWEVTLLEDRPELGLLRGDKCGLAKSVANALLNPLAVGSTTPAPKVRVHRKGL
jgi:hypothetical protein